jgi:hypothetical protein
MSGGEANTNIPFHLGNEPEQVVLLEQPRFDATPEASREDAPLVAFWSAQANPLKQPPNDLTGEVPTFLPGSINRLAAAQAAIASDGSGGDEQSILPLPHDENQLAGLLPFHFAVLDEEIQAFLQQVEQLGRELGSLLAGMNLSAWLVAMVGAAVAGEVVRRRLHKAQRQAFFAAYESSTLAWFPSLTGPWYLEEL